MSTENMEVSLSTLEPMGWSDDNKLITFIDTPGHAAFTEMQI